MARIATHPYHDPYPVHVDRAIIGDSLRRGWQDFRARPSTGIFLIFVYPLTGLLLYAVAFHRDLLSILFPLASGFAIIGPLTAVGLYAISARREAGAADDLDGVRAMGALGDGPLGPVVRIGLVLLAIYAAWIGTAILIYRLTLGAYVPADFAALVERVVSTPEGWTLLVVGCGAGFVFALIALAVGAMSLPAVYDRGLSARMAIGLSIRTFAREPGTLLAWGAVVAVGLVVGSIPAFLGLLIILPWFGHATWHLYRRLAPPD
ncbi:DUF2189 domain-containing protein [Acuticoccus sp. M5D2P5]|uniref:DUF2189 domain-containing protein n=1 Tax=Acuticoccus kalidii TaxID=2910977 RepID=UPI001F29FE5B|nr:DUF2189 domain-containing protein [Acuticoccus kalidii]MCF3935506.1 DUF2189 domain-containing protein [Acuticoccus kalidii]